MTIDQFAKILDYLITVILPPHLSNDDPVTEAEVLEVLEAQCDYLKGRIIETTFARDKELKREKDETLRDGRADHRKELEP